MKKNVALWTVATTALGVAVSTLVVSCGGGGSGGKLFLPPDGAPIAIDVAGAKAVAARVAAWMTVCDPSVRSLADKLYASAPPALAAMSSALPPGIFVPRQFTGTKPTDTSGACGGTVSYPSYSHSSGTTTATLRFTGYCFTDPTTGNTVTLNGDMPFVNTATPTSSGPITSKLTADSPSGIWAVVKNASATVLLSQVFSFSNLVYTPGIPGSTPTSAKPDSYTVGALSTVDKLTGTTSYATDISGSTYGTLTGGQKVAAGWRYHRANGDYMDVSTTVPLEHDSLGNMVAGALRYAGAGGSTAVATVVPGSTLQATLQVNGTAVSLPTACR